MLRIRYMARTGLILCLLTGCATQGTPLAPDARQPSQPQDAPDNASQAKTPATSASGLPASQAYTSPPPAAPSIQAGTSQPGQMPFTQEDGALQPDIQAYAKEVAKTRNIPQATVEQLLQSARYNERAAQLMTPSRTRIRRSWSTYRGRFVEPVRIKAGLEFWARHADELNDAQERHGVPAAIIVAIIGVETIYGRFTGDFRVLDVLATLGFRYPDASRPERSQLFRDQLADLMQLHHEGRVNAHTVAGSYAGAMGLPQFMPGSLLRYASDGNQDGRIDLFDPVDAINSVASFLRYHGWVPGLPVYAPAQAPEQAQALVTGGIDPSLRWQTLLEHGARAHSAQTGDTAWQQYPMGVVDLVDEPRNSVEYRIGTPNFFALTHYNRSYFYAASVAELARKLAQTMSPLN